MNSLRAMDPRMAVRPVFPAVLARESCAVLALVFVIAGATLPAAARDSRDLRATYGRGVHAYFAGQLHEAEQSFSQAIAAGSTDPRVYYFRSMARLQLGRQFEAENDMRLGASFEAQQAGDRPAISTALQRVQGHGRRTLEKFRRQARLERAHLIRSQTQNRYEQLQRRGGTVLHQDNPVRLELLLDPSSNVTAPARTRSPQPNLPGPERSVPGNGDPEVGDLGIGDPVVGKSASGDPATEDAFAPQNDQSNPFGFDEPDGTMEPEATIDEAPSGGEADDEAAADDNPFSEIGAPSANPSDRFSGRSPSGSGSVAAAASGGTSASGRLFFELGRWMSQPRPVLPGALGPPGGVAPVGFELGPAEAEQGSDPRAEPERPE